MQIDRQSLFEVLRETAAERAAELGVRPHQMCELEAIAFIEDLERRIARLTPIALAAKAMADVEGYDGCWKISDELRTALRDAGLIPAVEAVSGKAPLILYFAEETDRQEFIAVVEQAFPNRVWMDVP